MSTTRPVNRMSSAELLATAMERTPKGVHTAQAKRARVEIERRDANRAARKVAPASSRVTEVQVDALTAEARKVAGRIAAEAAGQVAQPGDIVRTKIRLRKDLLVALDTMGAEEFLATFADA